MGKAEDIQRRYYTETAAVYDQHLDGDKEHNVALEYMASFVSTLGISSMLDLGCGTGRGEMYFAQRHPSLRVVGVEPVKALIDHAIHENGVSTGQMVQASGEALPFPDASFDGVCELGVLHHVREPAIVVREMMRVARKAVFLSDHNRFGATSLEMGLLKMALYRAGLWGLTYRLRTGGKGYSLTEGDGLAYSYSVYDSFDSLARWAHRLIPIPTGPGKATSWCHPLLTNASVLLVAIKDPQSE
jgi:SAM-dependent methyltransferase